MFFRGEEWLGALQPEVTTLKPRPRGPHVYIVEAQVHSAQMLISECCTSTDPDLSCLVVTTPLSPSKRHSTDLSHLHMFNEYNLSSGKPKFLRRRKGFYESFSSRRKSLTSFILTIPWDFANLVKNYTSTPHRSETTGIAERAVRRMKEGTSAVLLQSGWDEKRWADSMECAVLKRKKKKAPEKVACLSLKPGITV